MLEINQGAEKSIKLKSLKNHCSVCEKEQKKVHDLSHFLQIWVPFFFSSKIMLVSQMVQLYFCFTFMSKQCFGTFWQVPKQNGTSWVCFLLILMFGEFLIPWAILAFAVSRIFWFYFFKVNTFFFFFLIIRLIKSIKHILYKTQFLPIEDLLMFLEVYFHLDVQWFTPHVSLEYSPLFINCSHVSKGMH